MARPLRTLVSGLIYHVTARGNAKSPIFLINEDREVFLAGLGVARHLDGMLCHAYCLMENHYHLLVETPRANLDDAMQRLNGTYAMRFNRHHERTGHVFQGRYGARLVTDDAYALTVVRYIAANPVQAGMCASPEEWPWSSHAATAGLAPQPRFLTATVLGWFGDHEEYRQFVTAGLAAASLERRPALAALVPSRNPQLIAAAHRTHGYSLAEIAAHLGVHRSTILRAVRRYESACNIGV
jgi:REP element-mobilizing transposase RayT